ncbi:MAG: polysaccharide pyruvyl transferase family protein [bacterium]|nr:polysaccharide pyruvyl transferase family protein [bacterium]
MKILIFNTCILNNGDALLVKGLYRKLRNDGHKVAMSDMCSVQLRTKKYPNIKWKRGILWFGEFTLEAIQRYPFLKKILIWVRVLKSRLNTHYDLIISAPGGYMNHFYGFEERLYTLLCLKKIHRAKLVMYSQSVGPLDMKDKSVLDKYMRYFDLFMVRDQFSYDFVDSYKNVILTNDAAFLNIPKKPNNSRSKIIGIAVREWTYDGNTISNYINNIIHLVEVSIQEGYKIEFISTCQGIQGYTDDSMLAKKIANIIPRSARDKVTVNTDMHTVRQLRDKIARYKCVVGTRLHMCILSILTGVPAFNISYEMKGIECYKQMGWEQFSCLYNDSSQIVLDKYRYFLNNLEKIEKDTVVESQKMHQSAEHYYQIFSDLIIKGAQSENDKNKVC